MYNGSGTGKKSATGRTEENRKIDLSKLAAETQKAVALRKAGKLESEGIDAIRQLLPENCSESDLLDAVLKLGTAAFIRAVEADLFPAWLKCYIGPDGDVYFIGLLNG